MIGIATLRSSRKLTGLVRRLVLGRVPRLFDTAFYLNKYPDAAASGIDPFLHYILVGGRRGYEPNGDFDTIFYRKQTSTRRNPLRHYIEIGAAAGFDPHPQFSTFSYLGRYPDVASSKANPLLHYRENGRSERRIADQSTRLPRVMVALVGIPSANHWMRPSPGQSRYTLTLLRTPPNSPAAERVAQLRVSICSDFNAVDGVVDAIARFPTGVQDAILITLNADPARGGDVSSLMLALDHCYLYPIANEERHMIRYAQAVVWDLRPAKPRVLVTLPDGTICV
jgi:hypothetical protein